MAHTMFMTPHASASPFGPEKQGSEIHKIIASTRLENTFKIIAPSHYPGLKSASVRITSG